MRGVLSETVVVSRVSLASLRSRAGSSFVIVIAMACVVGVLVSVMSVASGLLRASRNGADPQNVIVLEEESINESGSISREVSAVIVQAPGIAKGSDGRPLADAEVLINLPPSEGFAQGTLFLRGIGAAGLSLRPQLRIVSGRLFRPGLRELIVGVGAMGMFGLKVGDVVILPDGEWPIVGAFSNGGGVLESELVSDANTVMTSTRAETFNSVLVRLTNPTDFDVFKRWVTANPSLNLSVERQTDFYIRTAVPFMSFFSAIARFVAIILAIGALFGTLHIMYSSVSARTREIGTLRALGYNALPVAISIIVEAVLLSLAGALIGASIAWLLFNGKRDLVTHTVFELAVTPQLVYLGIMWALVIGLIGAMLPAVRAGRLPIADAIRAGSIR